MFTYNITFIVDPEKEKELIKYIRFFLLPKLFNSGSPAANPNLKKIVEAGGEKPQPDHGLSIALAASFDSEESAFLWNDSILLPALSDYNERFGTHSIFFITLLENIPV